MAPDGQLVRPGVVDLLGGGITPGAWQPANDAAQRLFLCREACQDLLQLSRGFDEVPLRRVLKNLTVPLVSLLDQLVPLLNVTGRPGTVAAAERSVWPTGDQETLAALTRAVRRHQTGTIRQVRNRLGAHLDHEVLAGCAPAVSAENILAVLGDCVALLLLLTNYRLVYVWIRGIPLVAAPPPAGSNVVETFFDYPAVVRWLADHEGNVLAARMSHLALDPRHEFSATFHEVLSLYHRMVTHADCGLPTLSVTPMANQSDIAASRPGSAHVMMAYPIEISVDL